MLHLKLVCYRLAYDLIAFCDVTQAQKFVISKFIHYVPSRSRVLNVQHFIKLKLLQPLNTIVTSYSPTQRHNMPVCAQSYSSLSPPSNLPPLSVLLWTQSSHTNTRIKIHVNKLRQEKI